MMRRADAKGKQGMGNFCRREQKFTNLLFPLFTNCLPAPIDFDLAGVVNCA